MSSKLSWRKYPTYLASRLGTFYERAGRVRCLGAPERTGALTLITAISPPGGDFSEPVTQACLRVAGAVWALDPSLAHQRHFPAVDWETSSSEYLARTQPWFEREGGEGWGAARRRVVELLQRGRELREIAALVGPDALQDEDRLIVESARQLRELVLAQSAYSATDASSPVGKTLALARLGLACASTGTGHQAKQAGGLAHRAIWSAGCRRQGPILAMAKGTG